MQSWPHCLPSLPWCLVQGCRCQMLLNMQRHFLLLSDGGLFLARVWVGAVRRGEGFLLEPVHTVCMEKSFSPVHSEMAASGRMGEGSWNKCVVVWGHQSLVFPALLYYSFKGVLSSGWSLNSVKQVGGLLCIVHRLLKWEGDSRGWLNSYVLQVIFVVP